MTATQDDQQIVIAVEDNGTGFVRAGNEDRLGLAGIERLAGLGSRLDITSDASAGTALRMILPRRPTE